MTCQNFEDTFGKAAQCYHWLMLSVAHITNVPFTKKLNTSLMLPFGYSYHPYLVQMIILYYYSLM
jgi:hypothetical protein